MNSEQRQKQVTFFYERLMSLHGVVAVDSPEYRKARRDLEIACAVVVNPHDEERMHTERREAHAAELRRLRSMDDDDNYYWPRRAHPPQASDSGKHEHESVRLIAKCRYFH